MVIDVPRLWSGGAATAIVAAVAPLTREGTMADKVSVGALNLLLGICLGSLLSAIIACTVVDRGEAVRVERRTR